MPGAAVSNPLVCGVLLTADRPEMTRRAIASFMAQTYAPKELLVLDTGTVMLDPDILGVDGKSIWLIRPHEWDRRLTVGGLRNYANGCLRNASLIAHFDSDDWSAPTRLAEQVGFLLTHPGVDVVGYNDMLYYDSTSDQSWYYSHPNPNFALGGSMTYWRSAWERKHFPDLSKGEDTQWIKGLRVASMSSLRMDPALIMVCEFHGANTSCHIDERTIGSHDRAGRFRRSPEWDEYARCIMGRKLSAT